MNFFAGQVGQELETPVIFLRDRDSGKKLYLRGKKAELLKEQWVGKHVVVGIRPEDIYEYQEAVKLDIVQNSVGIREVVETRENLGAEVMLYYTDERQNCAVRLKPSNQRKVGETIELYFDPDKVHVFDRETGESIFYKEEI